jgi:hypothetical protein
VSEANVSVRASLLIAALLCIAAAAGPARAEPITVGVYAPSAPFPSTAARVELATRLGEHLGRALGGAGVGRVYARAADFAAAVKKGEVTVALVDAAYLAGTGGYTVIAGVVRDGELTQAWQVIARGARKLAELRGKRVLVPSNGGREAELVLNVLLGGVERDFFGKIEAAPDTASALAALALGKADAAVVPAGVEAPAGTAQVSALPAQAAPVLVMYGAITAQRRTALTGAAVSFKGDATIPALRVTTDEGVRAIARRFAAPVKRGALPVPAARLVVGDLVEARELAIERTPASAFAIVPGAR